MSAPIKRLFWDIETSPNVMLSWRAGFKLNLGPDLIVKERAIICICYKWEGDSTVHYLTWDKRQSDKAMLRAFLAVANEADELVAHNGDRFDMAWFRTRCLYHKLPPLPTYKTVDTLKLAKRSFFFNSNKLDYIAQFLGLEGKLPTGLSLWKSVVLKNDLVALAKMVTYCQQDVTVLEAVWLRLQASSKPATHAGVVMGRSRRSCPRCGSDHVVIQKTRTSAAGITSHQMQCRKCNGYHSVSNKVALHG